MKIGLIDVDGHNFPNLALMKIASYHKNLGDKVEWVNLANYDRTYMSKVFTFSRDPQHGLSNYGETIKGGTGYNFNELPFDIDSCQPDYSIYPEFKDAYGFLTRGCPNHCSWCIVPKKEGNIRAYSDIEDFLQGRKTAILMDNNILAHEHGLQQIEKIIRLKIKVDFNQGLDARIIASDKSIAEMLTKVKWKRYLRIACDTKAQIPIVKQALKNLNSFGFKNYRVFVYVLIKNIPESLQIIEFLKQKGCSPFAQPYRNFENNFVDPEQKKLARWVNRKEIFKTVEYADYH